MRTTTDIERRKGKPRTPLIACLAVAATGLHLLFSAAPALAGQTHILEEVFGSAAQPSFAYSQAAAIDQSTGDVLVVERNSQQISRYHSDGTPSDFSALGGHVIDGVGPGADQTPQNGLTFGEPIDVQIAIDNSGTATDGNIYVTQNKLSGGAVQAVDIFASSGEYLGQITAAGASGFHQVSGAGQSPCGVAVDAAGDLYVGGGNEDAVYKYSPTANPPTNSDFIGTPFTTPHPCSLAAGIGSSGGALYATDSNSSSEFSGGYVVSLKQSSGATNYVVHNHGTPNDHPQHVSVDPSTGHVFVTTTGGDGTPPEVIEYDVSGAFGPTLVSSFSAGSNGVVVGGSTGQLYLVLSSQLMVYSHLVPLPDPITGPATEIERTAATVAGTVDTQGEELTECKFEYGLTTAYTDSAPCAESNSQIGTGTATVHADLAGLVEEAVYHYRLTVRNVNGPANPQGKDKTFQTKSKPEVLGLWSEGVGITEAALKAQINPQSAATSYRFEWGLTGAPSYEHTTSSIPIGSEPTSHTVHLFLQQLAPGATYHYRLVAENEIGTTNAPDHTFITFPYGAAPESDCANQPFRTGPSVNLPDCRAYEMVSPVNKNGGDVVVRELSYDGSGPGGYVQLSTEGNRLTYTAEYSAFAGQAANFRFDQYLSTRGGDGWITEGLRPPAVGRVTPEVSLAHTDREFAAFSPDLCNTWFADPDTPPIAVDAQPNHTNLYRRRNCGSNAGQLETITTSSSPLSQSTRHPFVGNSSVQGVSVDSRHVLFVAKGKLTEDASDALAPDAAGASPVQQVYDRFEGVNHLVSVLPSGKPNDQASQVGSGGGSLFGEGNLAGAVSADGSQVYWTATGNNNIREGVGNIYLRLHPEQGIVADECSEAGKACTLRVSAGGFQAFFWSASVDGSRALYGEDDGQGSETLSVFDLQKAEAEEPPRSLVAKDVLGVLATSADLSRIYFVSTAILSGAVNSEGDMAGPGKPNLYVSEAGATKFIATLDFTDVGQKLPKFNVAYNLVSTEPYGRPVRVTADGDHLVFQSRAPITHYDNADAQGGDPDAEVFLYREDGALTCISCNPSGARPVGRELPIPYVQADSTEAIVSPTGVSAAAWVPTWEHLLHASNALSADGDRLFFNSNDALLPRDTNGAPDVYEWEAVNAGRCSGITPSFFPQNDGCLYLISSGESPDDSEFWEASPDGRDVFFTTSSSLLPQDPGSIDLYDARVDGGFTRLTVPAACEGEACQSAPVRPPHPTPATSALAGDGNIEPGYAMVCRKPKVRRNGRCVRKRHRSQRDRKAAHGRVDHDRKANR